MKRKRVGRPTVITKAVVGKLEEAFTFDCNVEEACFYAGIHRDTYYTYCKEFPEFSDRITLLRNSVNLALRITLIKGALEDPNLALKYLERKRPQEFSLRSQVALSGEINNRHGISPEQEALIKQAFENFTNKEDIDEFDGEEVDE